MLGMGLGLNLPRGARGMPAWALADAALDLDFANKRYAVGGEKQFTDVLSFSRASAGVAQKLDGSWETFAAGVPRITDKGILIEEGRTNSVRNSTSAGQTGLSLPTHWSGAMAPTGLAQTVVGSGVDNGIPYTEIEVTGTSGAGGVAVLLLDSAYIGATTGQAWTGSVFVKLISGAIPGGSVVELALREHNASDVFQRQTLVALGAWSQWYRPIVSATLGADTAKIQLGIRPTAAVGSVWSYRIRIGFPQLEQGAFATSPIPTSGSAATRAADLCTGANVGWVSQGVGSMLSRTEFLLDLPPAAMVEWGLSDGAFNQSIYVSTTNLSGNRRIIPSVVNAGVGQISTGGAERTAESKDAWAWMSNDLAFCVNGGNVITDILATIPAVNQFSVGRAPWTGAQNYFNGYVKRLTYWPTRLPNATLQALTA